MATSGTLNGKKDGYKPTLRLTWRVLEQDIPGNRSRVESKLYLNVHSGSISLGRNNGKLEGSSFTKVGGSGSGLIHLATRTYWYNHNSDGTRKVNFSGYFYLSGVYFSGSSIGTLSVTGSGTLPAIPRGTTASSISIASDLVTDESNTISFTLNKKISSYSHYIAIRDGSTILQQWSNKSNPSSLTLSSSTVNKMLSSMRSVTSKQFTFRVSTYKDYPNGFIETKDYKFNARVSSTVVPEITEYSIDIYGNGYDKEINKYVQNISRVHSKFRSNSRGGAGVSSREIIVNNNGNIAKGGSVIDSQFQYTSKELTKSGSSSVEFKITDTRGRTATKTVDFNVVRYSTPKISGLKASRNIGESPTFSATVTHSPLDGVNSTKVIVQVKPTDKQTWVTDQIHTISSSQNLLNLGGNFETSLSDIQAYDIQVTAQDVFGRIITSVTNVPSGRAFISFREDWGVGVGLVPTKKGLSILEDVYMGKDEIPVVQRGSNTHGEWVKFYDGTLICWNRWVTGVNINNTLATGLYSMSPTKQWVYPASFIDNPVVFVDTVYLANWATITSTPGTTSVKWTVLGNAKTNRNQTVTIFSVGRWK